MYIKKICIPHCQPTFHLQIALGVLSLAQASCAAMIRTARDFVADVGEMSASKSGGLVALSKRNPKMVKGIAIG